MVADGVSTADLGTGEDMARFLRNQVLENKEKILEFLDSMTTDSFDGFHEKTEKFLLDLMLEINREAVAFLNRKLEKEQKKATDFEHPMSSTLILAFLSATVQFVHVGDSEVILVRNGEPEVLNYRAKSFHTASGGNSKMDK
jgi:serine/threonine protein phosphatase PrpC